MKDQLYNIWDWIKEDWKTHPVRFCLEVLCGLYESPKVEGFGKDTNNNS